MGSGFHTFFDTAIGRCGLAWRGAVVTGATLPGGSLAAARARLVRRGGATALDEPPPEIAAIVARIRALLEGGKDDLADIALDMERASPFEREVYALVRRVPPGETTTYGAVAAELGDPLLARAVGQAMGQNPFPPIVPCHRVLAAGGATGGFSAPGGAEAKRRVLMIEGAAPGGQAMLL